MQLFAECFPGFEDGRDIFRLVRCTKLPHHVVKDVDGRRGYSGGGAHGWSTAAGARMIGAEDKAVAIDKEKARTLHLKFRIACASRRLPNCRRGGGAGPYPEIRVQLYGR